MTSRSVNQWRHLGVPTENPPPEAGECAADHGPDRATHWAAVSDASKQRAERVVIGQVLERSSSVVHRPATPAKSPMTTMAQPNSSARRFTE